MRAIQSFLDYLGSFHELSESLLEYLRESANELSYPKNHMLLEKGATPEYLWFLVSGSARVFRYDKENSADITVWLFQSNQIILPLSGSSKPSDCYITLSQKSTLISISHIHLKYLNTLFSEYHFISKGFMEELIGALANHLDMLQHASHSSKYEQLIENNPDLFQDTNLKDIASYLGMSSTTLKHLRYP